MERLANKSFAHPLANERNLTRTSAARVGWGQRTRHSSMTSYTVAIVGMGPRGSYALECLTAAIGDSPLASQVQLLLFDDASHVGAGHVYDIDQPETNWINISERALELESRAELNFGATPVCGFPSYHSWAGIQRNPWPPDLDDAFPPRAHVGEYLNARAKSLIQPLEEAGVAALIQTRIERLDELGSRWSIEDSQDRTWIADEVLLTVGHQPTTTDDQIAGWEETVTHHRHLLLRTHPYPIAPIVDHLKNHGGKATIAVRGYGLAMMDVVRKLALSTGEFSTADTEGGPLLYRQRPGCELKLVPFSLDGQPMSPKPQTPALDALFAPTSNELQQLKSTLSSRDAQESATNAELLIEAIVPIAARVFTDLPNRHADAPTTSSDVETLMRSWLTDPETAHPSLNSHSTPPRHVLSEFVSMAAGASPISVDYCVGQVWRHCHPTIYASLSYNRLNDDALAATIALDERVKRYSFGPPVESIRQLGALASSGVLVLDFVEDPDIICDSRGWTLTSGEQSVTASVMVDSVLDGPRLLDVVSPLITDLLRDSAIQPVHDKLGIATREDATVCPAQRDLGATLSVLGRLAKGTVVGVDAILECYGDRPRRWAEGARDRLANLTG